jgi:hypothetical protein
VLFEGIRCQEKKTKQQPDLFLFSRFSAGRQPRTTAPGSTKQPEKPNS